MNVTGLHWRSVNIGSGNSHYLSQFDPDLCHHMVSLSHNELINLFNSQCVIFDCSIMAPIYNRHKIICHQTRNKSITMMTNPAVKLPWIFPGAPLTFNGAPSPDLNLTPLAAFLRFLPSAASLHSAKNVKKQQEVSDLNQDYGTPRIIQGNLDSYGPRMIPHAGLCHNK